jgi:multicomponent Na+:H+ antiporter subunit E
MFDRNSLKAAVSRLVIFSIGWLLLTEGSPRSWPLSLSVIMVSTAASLRLWPSGAMRFSLRGATRFAPYFLRQSILGGWDVALRALRPSMPVNPGFIRFEFELQADAARVFFAWTVSLLPGTVSARMENDGLQVHVLNRSEGVEKRLRRLEELVGSALKDKIER